MSKSFGRLVSGLAPIAASFFALLIPPSGALGQDVKFDSDTISGLGARNIGSAAMSGRVSAIAATKEDGRLTVYIGSASGGVWKSQNGGTTFKAIFVKRSEDAREGKERNTLW